MFVALTTGAWPREKRAPSAGTIDPPTMTFPSTLLAGPEMLPRLGHRTELPLEPPALFAAWSALLAIGYVALDAASLMFWIDPIPVKPWNPQAGLAVAFVYAGGIRYALPLFAAAWASEALLRHPAGPMLDQLVAAFAASVALAATGLAVRWRCFAQRMTGVAAVRDFLLIAASGAGLSALLYVGAHLIVADGGRADFYSNVLHKWLGDLAGIVVATPLIVLLLIPRAGMPERQPVWLDAGVFLLLLAAMITLMFSLDARNGERLFYLLFVPLIVLAMRRGLPGAAIGIVIVQIAIVASLWLAGRSAEDAAAYQMLMLVLGVTTLVLGAVAGERRRALAELARRSAELRAQQQALSDAMRVTTASETAATLAHELSQPLSAIGTYARAALEMLRRGTSSPAELRAVMERIVGESARTRETVQRIRDFFRTGVVRREPMSLTALVADVAEALRDRLRANAITLDTDVPAGLPRIFADPVQLGIVLHNLIGNAADAVAQIPAPRWIRVVAREHDALLEVEVADSGPGIDASVRDALFEPLATTKPTGMGLGLPISRTLIQAHGGHLELQSAHPTTFRFTLPTHANLSH